MAQGKGPFTSVFLKPLEARGLLEIALDDIEVVPYCEVEVPADKNFAHHVCEYHDEMFFVERRRHATD